MATLKDVAKDAGVSIATVSCCLSGARNVKPETRARIMDSVEKLKYIPNASARSLRSSCSNRIGIVLTDIDNTYHTEIFKGISSYFQRHGYTINVAFSNGIPEIECEKVDDFVSQNVSGLLMITCQPGNTDFFRHRINNFEIPTVFIERRPDDMEVNFAGFDNRKTIHSITASLLIQGCRDIALFIGNHQFSCERECIDGYDTAYRSHGLFSDSSLIYETNMSREDAFKTAMVHLSSRPVQAVITTSENIASGVLEAFHVLGLQVPRDTAVFTLSEESWNTSTKYPGVIHSSRTAFTLGRKAAALLAENIQNPALFQKRELIFSDELLEPLPELPKKTAPPALFTSAPSQDKVLRILMADLSGAYSAKLLSPLFTRETGISLEFEFSSHDKLLKQIISETEQSRNYFDIFMYDVPWLDYMAQNGLLADITDFVLGEQFHSSNLFPQNLANCLCQKAYYGIPFIGGSQIMFYRRDLFENREIIHLFRNQFKISLRPPRTWTEFNRITRFFTRRMNPHSPTEFGTSLAGSIDEELAPEILIRLWALDGNIWNGYNRVQLNTPENIRAFDTITALLPCLEKSPFLTSIPQTVDDFISGKTAMLITYTEYASQISKHIHTNTLGRVGYAPIPGRTPVSIGWNLGLNPFSSKSDSAYQYFNWLCQKENSYYMTILDGQSPVKAPYHSHELMKLYPWMELTEASFDYCRKRTGPHRDKSLVIPQNKLERILCLALRDIIDNGISAGEALSAAQLHMEALFKSYGYPTPLHFFE